MNEITSYWWIILILFAIVFTNLFCVFFFGMVIVPEDKIGLVTKNSFYLERIGRSQMAELLLQKEKLDIKLKHWLRDCIGECGFGSIQLI